MTAIYRDIELEWSGETYTVKPTMALLNKIEQRFSLARVAYRMQQGDTPVSHVACIVGEMLRSAGCNVSDDDVFTEMMTGAQDVVMQMCTSIILAAFPTEQKPKKKKVAAKKAT